MPNQSIKSRRIASTYTISRGVEDKDHFTGLAIDPIKWNITVAGGSTILPILPAGLSGGWIRFTDTGGGAGNAQLDRGTARAFEVVRNALLDVVFVCNRVAAADGTRLRVIFHNAGGFNAVGDWFGFEFSAVADPNFRIRGTAGGGAVIDIDSTVPFLAATVYRLTVQALNPQSVAFYINDILVGTIPVILFVGILFEPLIYMDDGAVGGGNPIIMDVDEANAYED